MNYLNDPHYDVDEAQLDHFDQGAAKRQRYLLWKERLNQVELQIEKAKKQNPEATKRLLIKGDVEVSLEAAKVFASSDILLLGNEPQTIGPQNAPMAVHLVLLGANVILLEGIRLSEVFEGVYFLNAAPLNLSGADGAPCRAILIDVDERQI